MIGNGLWCIPESNGDPAGDVVIACVLSIIKFNQGSTGCEMNGCFIPDATRLEDNPMARENITKLINTSISANPLLIDFTGACPAINIDNDFLMVLIDGQSNCFG